VPALRAVRRLLPDAEVALAARAALEPLVAATGAVDVLVDTSGPVPPAWRGPSPVLAVDLHGRGPQSHLALQSLSPRRLVAFACPEIGHPGPTWRADEHERSRWCRLVREELGAVADPDDVRLEAPSVPAEVPGAVVVHPGAASGARRWPVERFGAVARWAVASGYDVVVTGGRDEVALASAVRGSAGLPAHAVTAGRTDLEDLAAQVAEASLVICGDTGVAHLASAYGVPSVVLFGPVPPGEWGPPSCGPHVAIWKGTERGDPHASRVDPALLTISAEEVVRRAEALLDDAQSVSARTASSGTV
jgi:hypothetical protein